MSAPGFQNKNIFFQELVKKLHFMFSKNFSSLFKFFFSCFRYKFGDVLRTADQVRGGGGRHGRQDLHAHILHHRLLPRGICSYCVSIQYYSLRQSVFHKSVVNQQDGTVSCVIQQAGQSVCHSFIQSVSHRVIQPVSLLLQSDLHVKFYTIQSFPRVYLSTTVLFCTIS